jgi:hypothetical protein
VSPSGPAWANPAAMTSAAPTNQMFDLEDMTDAPD